MKIQDLGYVVLGGVIVAVGVGLIQQKVRAVKVLIVTDGSVNAESSPNAPIGHKVNGKHKWDSKAASVTVYSGPTPAEACNNSLAESFTDPQSVAFTVMEETQTGPQAPVLTTVLAARDGSDGDKLHLTMEGPWRFALKNVQLKRTLERPGDATKLRLRSIVVKVNNVDTSFGAAEGKYLCAIFTD